ncbi:MAG TPA: HepT-like ribonuclease domain-containing protein [Nitrospinota bacterium]|nr:HepT-like ribonuclease domain-containing protein [Nitrospinota bacterium]
MSPVEKDIVRKKLAVIIDNLKALEPIKGMSRADYIEDIYKRKAAERLLQELIEAAIDINTHIIVQIGNPAPDDYYESFIKLGELLPACQLVRLLTG